MRSLACCLLLLVLAPYGAHAQGRLTITAGGGLALSTAPGWLTDLYGYGYNLKAGIEYQITDQYGIVLRGGHDRFFLDEDAIRSNLGQSGSGRDVEGPNVSLTAGLLGMKVSSAPQGPMQYYALVLGGLFKTDTAADLSYDPDTNPVVIELETATEPGVSLGGGIDFGLSPQASFRFEFNYNIIFTEDEMSGYFPVSVLFSFTP
jgi:hypothetical protein